MRTINKMKTRLFLIGCGAAMITMTSGCTKDNPLNPAGNCFDGNWAAQFSDENPTQGNCDDYKNAAKGYLDALNEVYNCVPNASRAEIDQAINEAKADIDGEDCD
jgi:hypothetical protein